MSSVKHPQNTQWYYTRPGLPSQTLERLNFDLPRPNTTEITIDVKAVALNPIDDKIAQLPNWMRRIMGALPFGTPHIPCRDFAGVVAQVGEGVEGWKEGDAVLGRIPGYDGKGSLQYRATIPASSPMVKKPDDLSWIEAAGMPLVYTTVYESLVNRGNLSTDSVVNKHENRSVLILGGTSGTGSTAIQLAKQLGLSVVTTCSGQNEGVVCKLGADEVIDYRTENVIHRAIASQHGPFSVVLDCVGGTQMIPHLGKILLDDSKRGGRGTYISLAGDGSSTLQTGTTADLAYSDWRRIRTTVKPTPRDDLTIFSYLESAFPRYQYQIAEPSADVIKTIPKFLSGGNKVLIDTVFSFNDAKAAFARIESGRAKGKVIVEM